MRQLLTKREEVNGKTIEAVEGSDWDDFIAILFTDGTALVFNVNRYEDYKDITIMNSYDELEPYDIRSAGLCNNEEMRQIETARAAIEAKKREELDRQHYEQLRRKFGDEKL